MKYRKTYLALGLLAAGALAYQTVPALAAGLWPNFSLVGSASFCSSTNTAGVPGTSSVCTTTTPAGPSIVSGLETVPADTNKASGAAPQTVRLSLASLNALPISMVSGASTTVISVSPTVVQGGLVFSASGTMTQANVTLPPSPIDGQQFLLTADQTITALNVTGSGTDTVSNSPTALTKSTTAAYGYRFRYSLPLTKWFRLQ